MLYTPTAGDNAPTEVVWSVKVNLASFCMTLTACVWFPVYASIAGRDISPPAVMILCTVVTIWGSGNSLEM